MDEHCTDADTDERIVLAEFRNPFQTVLAGFADSLQAYRPNQSTKPPLGYEYILRARNFLVPNGEQVLQTRPSLTDLPHLQDFFATRADWIYVDESLIDQIVKKEIQRQIDIAGSPAAFSVQLEREGMTHEEKRRRTQQILLAMFYQQVGL